MNSVTGYPYLRGADVYITSPHGDTWKLSSQTLRYASSIFATLLDSHNYQIPTKKQNTTDSSILWRFKMIPQLPENHFVNFQAQDPAARSSFDIPININGIEVPSYIRTYDNFFKCLYAIPPDFEKEDIGQMISEAFNLLNAAERLGAASVVRNSVENQLLRAGKDIWVLVAREPGVWADFAARLQSPSIFQEAMAHIVGAFNLQDGLVCPENIRKLQYGFKILALAKKKNKHLNIQKKSIERQLVSFSPQGINRSAINGSIPGRASYASDIYYWQAMTCIRQYITLACFNDHNYRAPDGGFTLYKQLADGGDAYLGEDSLNDFHQLYPMTAKGERCFAKALSYIKEEYKGLVAPLFLTNIQGPSENLKYLVNAEVLDKEMPWLSADGAVNCDPVQLAILEGIDQDQDTDNDENA